MDVILVPPQQVAEFWPRVRAFLEAARKRGYDRFYSEWDIKKGCIKGEYFLWVAVNDANEVHAAAVQKFIDYPQVRVSEVPLVGGKNLRDWLEKMVKATEEFAISYGAAIMAGGDRVGWTKVAGYREVSRVFHKELGDG